MADEVNMSFLLPGEPAANVATWRASAPPFLDEYKRVDESYESLVYESDVTTTFAKWATFGMAKTLYRLSFTFRPEAVDPPVTRVSVLGQSHDDTVVAMSKWAAAHTPA
jgi:hypothetical protein